MLYFPLWKKILVITVCFFGVLFSVPSFLNSELRGYIPEWMPARTVNLGLDLQGGSQLLLEVDFESYQREQLVGLMSEIRSILREQKIGYRSLRIEDDAVVFTPRDTIDIQAVETVIHTIDSALVVENKDSDITIGYSDVSISEHKKKVLSQSVEIVNRRVNETGTKEPIIQRQGDNRILLQVPGLADPEHLKNLLGRTAKMTFHLVDETVSPQDIEMGIAPPGSRIVMGDHRDSSDGRARKYAIYSQVMLSGDRLEDSTVSYDQNSGQPVVAFRFDNDGARKFGEITSQNIGKPFAILLDNRVITAPVIRSAILGGSGIIEGGFTTQGANDLSLLLRAGALPAPLNVIEERSVGPSLGADSIEAGAKACVLGIILVVAFMTLFYGRFGFYANVAMVINALMIISVLAMFGATLTLPGIAGIVLTMGMAVDANVLIYERIREELRNGKSVFKAVEDGFKLAFGTILDSNITTLMAAIILFSFGSGTIKGFAVTLAVGILCSMFTSIMVTRLMVVQWLNHTRPKTLSL